MAVTVLVCFHSNAIFLTIYNSSFFGLHAHKIWKRSVEKYRSYGTLSNSLRFLSLFCKAGVVQLSTEAQAVMVQDGLRDMTDTVFFHLTLEM